MGLFNVRYDLERFCKRWLQEILNTNRNTTLAELLLAVKEAVAAFVLDAPQFDDITMLALTIKEGDNELTYGSGTI